MKRQADSSAGKAPFVADSLDRGILRRLQFDARRPFSAIADELGVSDHTVARRYQRLRAQAGVRVVAISTPDADNSNQFLLRIRAKSGMTSLTASLARRPDLSWITVISGAAGLELSAMAHPRRSDSIFILAEQLSQFPSVEKVTVQSCLHMYYGGSRQSLLIKPAVSTTGDGPSPADRSPGIPRLDDADHRLLSTLTVDGRATVDTLSRASGLSRTTVTSRLERLTSSGLLYFDVDFDPATLGLNSSVSVWAEVVPAQLGTAGATVATHDAVSFAAATTGATNLYWVAHCDNTEAMYDYLVGPVADIAGLLSVETAPHVRSISGVGNHRIQTR